MKSGRTPLTFSVIGMAAREAMLLKSFVRMLDSRTKQRWVYRAQQNDHEQQAADLTFLGDEGEPPEANAAATGPRQLRMGVLALDEYAKLDRPLRPDELERELNRMGKLLVTARMQSASTVNVANSSSSDSDSYPSSSDSEKSADSQPLYLWQLPLEGSTHSQFVPTTSVSTEFAGTIPASLPIPRALLAVAPVAPLMPIATASPELLVPSVPSLPPVVIAASPVAVPENPAALPVAPVAAIVVAPIALLPTDGLRMLRWPHASLINTPSKLKLAAFMASGANTLENLQRTSGQPMQACSEFLQALHASGFLAVKPFMAPAADSMAQPRQSVARPAAQAPSRKPESANPQRAAATSAGLFSRIRARLGISTTG